MNDSPICLRLKPFTSVDFQQAKAKHIAFKSWLRALLYDQPDEFETTVLSQYVCDTGQWLYGYALIAYDDVAQVHELEKVHASFHVVARELSQLYRQGDVDKARQGLVEMERITDRLVELLHEVEEQVINRKANALMKDTREGDTLSALLETNERLDVSSQQQVADGNENNTSLETQWQILHDFFMQAPAAHCILRGPTHIYEFANPAYRELIGKRDPIGKTVREILPELERQGMVDQLHSVYATGESFVGKEVPIALDQGNGETKLVYLNLVYQPIKNRLGGPEGILVFAYEVTEQVMARKAIEESESRFRSLIEKTPIATALFRSKELIIDLANEVMIGYWQKGPSVVGKPYREAVPELLGQGYFEKLEEIFQTGREHHATGARADIVENGVTVTSYFNYSYTPLFDGDGKVYAVLNMGNDVTEQVLSKQRLQESEGRYRMLAAKLEQLVQQRTVELETINKKLATTNNELAASNTELEKANELLKRSNDNLQKFAFVASHDLQEPLRKIQSFGDLLKNQYELPSDDAALYLERMQSAASRMSFLIRDLLVFSRISTRVGMTQLVSLTDVVEAVQVDLKLVIEKTNARVTVSPLPTVVGDASQLGQLFLNLISNALTFHRVGQSGVPVSPLVQIRSEVVARVDLPPAVKPTKVAQAYYQIDVIDNGIGFEEKYLDRIFQVFQRLHGKNEFSGTGVGLAICEKVIFNHGGAITATSQPGQGSTFHVFLPVH